MPVKSATFAPVPMASDAITTTVQPLAFNRRRAASRTSASMTCNVGCRQTVVNGCARCAGGWRRPRSVRRKEKCVRKCESDRRAAWSRCDRSDGAGQPVAQRPAGTVAGWSSLDRRTATTRGESLAAGEATSLAHRSGASRPMTYKINARNPAAAASARATDSTMTITIARTYIACFPLDPRSNRPAPPGRRHVEYEHAACRSGRGRAWPTGSHARCGCSHERTVGLQPRCECWGNPLRALPPGTRWTAAVARCRSAGSGAWLYHGRPRAALLCRAEKDRL